MTENQEETTENVSNDHKLEENVLDDLQSAQTFRDDREMTGDAWNSGVATGNDLED